MKEEEVKDKYPEASLHDIDRNRICLTLGQLKMILGLKDDRFNDIFIDLCEKELKRKKYKSLDFYDLTNVINRCFKEVKVLRKSESQKKLKKVSFKEDCIKIEEKPKEQKDGSNGEGSDVQKRLNKLENRLEMVEKRLEDVEEAIKEGY